MTTPGSAPPGVYHSRSRVTRNRLALAAAGLALVLLGYLIGRLQDGSAAPAAVAAPPPSPATSTAEASPEASPELSVEPSSVESSTAAPVGIDAYSVIQAEAAAGQQGTEFEPTEDQGGGQNVGWINAGDWLRFDDVNFGDTAATQFAARVASDVGDDGGGRVEVRIDSPGNPPAGTLSVDDTDGWQSWQTRTTAITPTTGLHTLFLTFASDDDAEFMNLNYFAFVH
jgi:hypothetical protein